jgi:Tfp pilus assembly protein PilX
MLNIKNNQKGFAVFFITILILAVMFGIGVSITILTLGEQNISRNIIKSSQSYYMAEAGVEDALLKLSNNSEWVKESGTSYVLEVGDATTTITVSGIIGGSRTIISEGNMENRVRKIGVSYEVSTERVSFYYGAQIDEGGMIMYNNSKIEGNIFSNGSVILSGADGDKGIIAGEVIVSSTSTAGNNRIKGLKIGEESGADVFAYSCESCSIGGKLYLSGGTAVDCEAEGGIASSEAIAKKPLPITQEQIDKWKTEASSSETWVGDYEIAGKETESFGPRKIEGSLTIGIKGTLIMKGTIWVTGTTTINNKAVVKLDPEDYGSRSGVLIVDGRIIVENGAILEGSDQKGSYLMLLSTNPSLLEEGPAIDVKNNALAAIFYTTRGLITLGNNMEVREITGYKILLQPNATIKYETGLIDTLFTSGPGGSWEVTSWKETE